MTEEKKETFRETAIGRNWGDIELLPQGDSITSLWYQYIGKYMTGSYPGYTSEDE